jgi:drug/metabolite transporter (DMT)-like permease
MLSLTLGLVAACLWAAHDLLARKLSQGASVISIVLVVLATGSVALAIPALAAGGWAEMTALAWVYAMAAGLAFALAIGGLYRAFSLAPVRLVAPVVGAYPMLSLAVAMAQGRPVSAAEWLAVLVIVGGIGIVAATADGDADDGPLPPALGAMVWAGLGAVGFAATFALGQAATRHGAELPVMLVTRLVALAVYVALALAVRAPVRGTRPLLPVLALMGAFDAAALGLVTASGALPHPEYAAVASALFGVLTILLAWRVLGERVAPVQWAGIGAVFAGIGMLSFLG